MRKEWLLLPISLREYEDENLEMLVRMAEKWDEFIASMQKGDEVWLYRSPPETWRAMAGNEGVAIVRAGELIKTLILRMN